jgi:hypothetical protein
LLNDVKYLSRDILCTEVSHKGKSTKGKKKKNKQKGNKQKKKYKKKYKKILYDSLVLYLTKKWLNS